MFAFQMFFGKNALEVWKSFQNHESFAEIAQSFQFPFDFQKLSCYPFHASGGDELQYLADEIVWKGVYKYLSNTFVDLKPNQRVLSESKKH